MNSEQLHQTIRRTVAHRAGSTDASAIAGSTVSTWEQVAARLSPVIGVRGVEVLFGRALQLTRRSFPWLDAGGDLANSLEAVRALLASHEATAAAEAGCSLLENFTDLLAALIGTSLSDRLLAPVWEPPALEPKPEQRHHD